MKEKIYKVFDDVLSKENLKHLQDIFFNEGMTWFYRDSTVHYSNDDDTYYFSHALFYNNEPTSGSFNTVFNFFKKILDIRSIIQIRANLTLNPNIELYTGWHTDTEPYNLLNGEEVDFKTAIFYLNTNNGSTFLNKENTTEVKAIANRLLVFDGSILHRNKYTTDEKRRIIINFNYV